MSGTISCDSKGRVVLPHEMRKQLGTEFYIIKAQNEIVLIPVSKDPIKALGEMGKKAGLGKWSIAELKQESRKQAEKEIEEELRQHGLRR